MLSRGSLLLALFYVKTKSLKISFHAPPHSKQIRPSGGTEKQIEERNAIQSGLFVHTVFAFRVSGAETEQNSRTKF
jgi:hypothetical protein